MVETFRWLIHSVESILVVCRARADRLEREIEPDAHLHARIATCFRFVIGDLLSSAIHRHLSSIFFLSFVYKNIIYIFFFHLFFSFFGTFCLSFSSLFSFSFFFSLSPVAFECLNVITALNNSNNYDEFIWIHSDPIRVHFPVLNHCRLKFSEPSRDAVEGPFRRPTLRAIMQTNSCVAMQQTPAISIY